MNKYEPIRVLGQGGYGKAILVKRRNDGKLFVIKEVRLTALSPRDREEATKEAKVLSSLHSPFIVSFEESFQERGCFYIVMEYADGGDLSQKIQSRGNRLFTEEEILKDFIQLALAIKYIHDRRILHRDLKAQNVFIMRDGTIKLGDFGIARVLERTFQLCNTQIGSPYYLSPEICEGRSYNSKTDIWSLGCILYELCTLRHAFNAANMNGLLMNIVRGKFNPIPPTFSKELKQLISKMLTKDANTRPSINAVLATPIIRVRLRQFYDETLSLYQNSNSPSNSPSRQKAQIYRPKLLRGVGPSTQSDQDATSNDDLIVAASRADRNYNQISNKNNANEVESIIMKNRENRKQKKNQTKQTIQINQNNRNNKAPNNSGINDHISPEKAAAVIYGDSSCLISSDSYLQNQANDKPQWAKSKSNQEKSKKVSQVKQNQASPLIYNVMQSSKGKFITRGRSNISSHSSLGALSPLNSSRNSKSSASASSSPTKKKERPPPPQSQLSTSKAAMNYSLANDEEFERIFGLKRKETEMNTKKMQELESRQKKLKMEKPVLPFVDDVNRRKIQLQRAEIENKRARMRELQREKSEDEKLIEEIMHELDEDPILQAAERGVRKRCGPINGQLSPQKINIKKSSSNPNVERYIEAKSKVKSPQQAIHDANFHLYSVQCLASSIRDALLLPEEDENDTSFVDTSSPSPLLHSQSTAVIDSQNNEVNIDLEMGGYDRHDRRSSFSDAKLMNDVAENDRLNEGGNHGRFYLNDKELNFPVVSNGDTLSYRAEAIRAFLERELGIDKLLEIRQRLVNPEGGSFDYQFDDVDPGLVILAQQLVILDEMILNQ